MISFNGPLLFWKNTNLSIVVERKGRHSVIFIVVVVIQNAVVTRRDEGRQTVPHQQVNDDLQSLAANNRYIKVRHLGTKVTFLQINFCPYIFSSWLIIQFRAILSKQQRVHFELKENTKKIRLFTDKMIRRCFLAALMLLRQAQPMAFTATSRISKFRSRTAFVMNSSSKVCKVGFSSTMSLHLI